MQIFIAKEQLGDFFDYTLDESKVFANALNTIDIPAYFKYMYSVDSAQECMMNENCKKEFISKNSKLDNQIDKILNIKNTYELKTNEIIINKSLINVFGVADELSTENGQLQKIKRWEKEEVSKSTIFTQTSKNGKGKCILQNKDTYKIYPNYIKNKNILDSTLPEGNYTIWYQLATPEIEQIETEGELKLYPGQNNIITDDHVYLNITGPKKYLNG